MSNFRPGIARFSILLCVMPGLQWLSGAYASGSFLDPDEPAHIVSGVAVGQYVTHGLGSNPVTWATAYYLHYPKVAIGHWPPVLKWSQRVSGVATAVSLMALAMLNWFPWAAAGTAAVGPLMVLVLNWPLYCFLAECGGWWFAIRCFPVHLAYFLCSVSGFAIANVRFRLASRPNAEVTP